MTVHIGYLRGDGEIFHVKMYIEESLVENVNISKYISVSPLCGGRGRDTRLGNFQGW